jgi:MFS family permease
MARRQERFQLTQRQYKINFAAFVWHATLLAFSKSFFDTDTIFPALIIKAGGGAFLIGLLTTIMVGSAKFMQLFFAPYISAQRHKRTHLLIAINLRAFSILGLGFVILFFPHLNRVLFFVLLFTLVTIFSWSGSYGGVAYADVLGKSIDKRHRLSLFSLKQTAQAIGFIASAFIVRYVIRSFEFPKNYAYSFFIASAILLVASLGYWVIKEKIVEPRRRKSIIEFIKLIPTQVRRDKNLKYFLLTVNLLGIYFAFSPFMVSFVKKYYHITGRLVGNVLLLKMFGVVAASLIAYFLKRKIRYKHLLFAGIALTVIIPILSLVFVRNLAVYKSLFFLSGMTFSSIRIANESILIEISNDHNRAEYAGIVGAGNLSGIIFPFLIGTLLSSFGYTVGFVFVAVVALISLAFASRLDCRRPTQRPDF